MMKAKNKVKTPRTNKPTWITIQEVAMEVHLSPLEHERPSPVHSEMVYYVLHRTQELFSCQPALLVMFLKMCQTSLNMKALLSGQECWAGSCSDRLNWGYHSESLMQVTFIQILPKTPQDFRMKFYSWQKCFKCCALPFISMSFMTNLSKGDVTLMIPTTSSKRGSTVHTHTHTQKKKKKKKKEEGRKEEVGRYQWQILPA